MSERLHKLLAQHGLGSRREIEKWMLDGRVLLNDAKAQPGASYSPGDRVVVDGQDVSARLRITGKPQVIAYHKPQGQPIVARTAVQGELTTLDETVMERLPAVRGSRWLVINTMQPGDSGLLMLTSDGRLADALRRRAEHIRSAYVARVLVPTSEFDPATISRTVQYDDQTVEFESIEPAGGEGTNRWFRVDSAHSHRRAAVRALFEISGLKVSRVIQVRFANIELPRDLPRGKHRVLSEEQISQLYEVAELNPPVEPAAPGTGRRTHSKTTRQRSTAKAGKPSNRPSRPAPPVEREASDDEESPRSRAPRSRSALRAHLATSNTKPLPAKRDAPARGRSGAKSSGRATKPPGQKSANRSGHASAGRPGNRGSTGSRSSGR